ncbi:dynein axonemal intermediate chain 4 isoform X2 [Zeugodacus cucurbitae]|uniref:dynein axonemal intermediate chain 4 isoform X2 n=1 Tax=Zeugodacus cucurbitae TaxID=28588 RepID=UPI0023D92E72|nr:dynein axonemal intermediate chain 4 isoform X2 [Zeugodacus cucurbitae]XP_054088181.1 dynein axonemal intermediate chain 4 isoform X2 [Zeugodacus cucurbitae]
MKIRFSDKKKSHISRVTYTSALGKEIENAILWRDALEVHDIVHGKSVVVTPKYIDADRKVKLLFRGISTYAEDHIREMTKSSSAQSLNSRRMSMNSVKAKSSTRLGVKLSLDEIIQAIGSSGSLHEFHNYYHELSHAKSKPLPFIKVVLRKSPAYVLYHQNSVTVPKGSEEGEAVEHDNRIYDYLTIGKGKIRRRSDAETQTVGVLKKSRIESTVSKKFSEKGAYVSFFEMFDTYQQLLKTPMALNERHSVSTGVLDLIAKNPQFSYAAMVVERILASNCYHEGQRRYRNMEVPTKMAKYAEYKYSLNLLYRLLQPKFQGGYDFRRKAISAMSFCQGNGDLIAVAYGFYSDASKVTVPNGNVCVWSMKNPQNPERIYSYPVPVSAVEFSPFLPFLIAVGLYDGSVQVRNISKPDYPPVAISQRSVLLSCEPVMAIQWIRQQQDDTLEADPFLALTRDGKVAKFRIIPSPYLLGMRQMELLRVEGNPEGLQSKSFMMNEEKSLDSGRHASGLHVVMHPLQDDIYYILTDEGCIQKCSLNHTHHYLEMLKVHEGSVNHMDFSPWSPKLFLTCGNDWTIRIWLEGIYQPLITLCDRYMPVHCAMWSRTHSTVIIAVNRDTVDIWDLRRTLLAPISTINIDSSFHTLARLSICGRSLAIGNERGNVLMCSFEHMPFQSHNQYAELEKALYNAIKLSPTLMQDLKNIGYFGYKLEDGHSKSVYWKYK